MMLVRMESKHLDAMKEVIPCPDMTPEQQAALCASEHSHSILDENGEVLLCGGIVEYWKHRGECWVLIHPKAKLRKNTLPMIRIIKNYLKNADIRRVEAAVSVTLYSGHKLARALGFKMESPKVTAYMPNGGDASMYVRLMNERTG